MKLEKREITLNETDSLKDIYYMEKTLLREYSARLALAKCQDFSDFFGLVKCDSPF